MADHGQHEHADDGAVRVHIHSWKLYAGVLGALLFLTVITVAVSYVDIDGFLALGRKVEGVGAWNLFVAVLVATIKAALVVTFFMHLKDDSRFNALIFIGSVLFIGVFFAYTMNDTSVRGTMDRYNGVTIDPDRGTRAPGGIPAPIPGEVLEPGMQVAEPAGGGETSAAAAAPTEVGTDAPTAAPREGATAEQPAAAAAPEEGGEEGAPEGGAAEPAPVEGPAPAE